MENHEWSIQGRARARPHRAWPQGWREDFAAEGATTPLWFGFVQIAGWNYGNETHSLVATAGRAVILRQAVISFIQH